MSILIIKNTRLLVQGITGNEGLFHTTQMVAYGTNVVAGVTQARAANGYWMEKSLCLILSNLRQMPLAQTAQ